MGLSKAFLKNKDAAYMERLRASFHSSSSEKQNESIENHKEDCYKFMETEEYNDKDTVGYGVCCELYELCGMSGWWIFFIIVIVFLVLAGAGAAFWFFYLKRKMGGRDEEEKDMDSEESSTKKSDYDISIDTY